MTFQALSTLDDKAIKNLTIPMGVISNGPLVDRAYREALPYQYMRELITNAVEANATEINFQPDWVHIEACKKEGVEPCHRFLVSDNGKGMSSRELERYFNNLSASGHVLTTESQNFGMGAKISLLPWNTEGLIIMSWDKDSNGTGSMIRVVKRQSDQNYGLFLFQDDDGTYQKVAPAPQVYKDRFLSSSDTGTIIIGLGSTGSDESYLGPTYSKDPSTTSINPLRAVNARFFVIPNSVKIRHTGIQTVNKTEFSWDEKDRSAYSVRNANGAKSILDTISIFSGVQTLQTCKAHWWIIDLKKLDSQVSFNRTTFIGALHNNELYNVSLGKFSKSRFNQCGVLFEEAKKRLVLLFEPLNNGRFNIFPNTTRSALVCTNNETLELPWNTWAQEFSLHMPSEVKKLCEDSAVTLEDTKHSIKERLKDFIPRLASSFVSDSLGAQGNGGKLSLQPKSQSTLHTSADVTPKQRKDTKPRSEGTQPARKTNPKTEPPKALWVSRSEMTEERLAAEYSENVNTLKINKDFFVYTEVYDYWLKRFADTPGAEQKMLDIIRDVYQVKLAALVIHAYHLGTKSDWANKWRDLVTSDALTASILGLATEHDVIAKRVAGLGFKTSL